MVIETVNIVSFGNLRDVTLRLAEGINVIEGGNESGKSTLAAFLCYVFYGFSDKSEREKHLSFATGSAEGSITLHTEDEKSYRIERRTAGRRDECRIIELSGNTQVFAGEVPGIVFFGVPESVFVNSSCIRQIGGNGVNGREIGEAVDNILFSADETVNLQKALKKLDDARVELLHKNQKGGLIAELTEKRDALLTSKQEVLDTNREILSLEGALGEIRRKIEETENKAETLRNQLRVCAAHLSAKRKSNLETLKKQLILRKNKLREITELYTSGDFIPDDRYVARLTALITERNYLVKLAEAEAIEAENEANKLSEEELRLRKTILSLGGKQELIDRFRNYRSKRRTHRTLSVIFAVLFVLASAGTVLLLLNSPKFAVIGAIFVVSMLTLLIVSLVNTSKNAKTEFDLLDKLDFDDTAEFFRVIDDLPDQLEIPEAPKHDEKAEELARNRIELEEECARFGGATPDDTLEEARTAIEALRFCKTEVEKYEAAYSSALAQSEDDEETIDLDSLPPLPENFDVQKVRREFEFMLKATEALRQREHEMELRLTSLSAGTVSPSDIADRVTALDLEIRDLTAKHNAYQLAYDALSAAGEGLRDTVSPRLSEYAGKIMSSITSGKYGSVGVDNQMNLTFTPDSGSGGTITCSSEFMSAGTSDAAYLSLRLALVDLLCRKERPPLIFDESFCRLDDNRLASALSMLSESTAKNGQVILLTALDREARLLSGKKFERIAL